MKYIAFFTVLLFYFYNEQGDPPETICPHSVLSKNEDIKNIMYNFSLSKKKQANSRILYDLLRKRRRGRRRRVQNRKGRRRQNNRRARKLKKKERRRKRKEERKRKRERRRQERKRKRKERKRKKKEKRERKKERKREKKERKREEKERRREEKERQQQTSEHVDLQEHMNKNNDEIAQETGNEEQKYTTRKNNYEQDDDMAFPNRYITEKPDHEDTTNNDKSSLQSINRTANEPYYNNIENNAGKSISSSPSSSYNDTEDNEKVINIDKLKHEPKNVIVQKIKRALQMLQ
ncbi:conserved Plasmodium protein, unknown function [Plasmodium malariae]|uniref:Fam-c protein n=1 Tax=Plasmodium malariae TaxID=5858 RepID=A0A1C3K9U3_PLAMA|nr:conserved Plasmodium protein, unknown function [Plasmodium malariae]